MKAMMHGALAFGLVLTLAACGGGSDGDGDDGGQAGPGPAQSNFGQGFQALFEAGTPAEDGLPGGVVGAVDTTIDPVDPKAGDLIAVSFTTDPVAVP